MPGIRPDIRSRLAACVRPLWRARGPQRLLQRQDGNAAVEFALVAAPFFALLFAILETALVFFAQQVLQSATTEASRLIMTGQAQSGSTTAAEFQQAVCADAGALFNCADIYVNVQTFSSFSSVSQLNPLSGGNFNSGSMNYSIGTQGDIELVQVFYQWPVYTAPLGFSLSNMNGNSRLLVATAVFRNEPY
ncbi:MAG: TadE/TadG family type IV pilus assembly protein [Rhizomicrobium sp.]|jgi:Flp pilus assembly protein TadG